MPPSAKTYDHLLTKTDALFDSIYVVRDHFALKPRRDHVGSCLNFRDLQEMRSDFVRKLSALAVPFVYSQEKQQEIVTRLSARTETAAAWHELRKNAVAKFRACDLRGQFSELLLFCVLQHVFRAVPLLRKMSLTTNPAVERHGADALHISMGPDGHRLYLGEAKTYKREKAALKAALTAAIESIAEAYENHANELSLYLYEDFIPPELESVAIAYKEGRLPEARVELVCLVTYEAPEVMGASRDEFLEARIKRMRQELGSVAASIYAPLKAPLIDRMNYVMFEVSRLEDLLDAFRSELYGGQS